MKSCGACSSLVFPRSPTSANFSETMLFFFLSFFPFELRSRRASWSSNRISARKFFIEINDKSSMGWICEGEIIRPFFSLSPPLPRLFPRTFPRKWENGVDGHGSPWILRGSGRKALKFHRRRITGPFYRGE